MNTERKGSSVSDELLQLKSFAQTIMAMSMDRSTTEVTVYTTLDDDEVRAPKSSLRAWRMAVNDCIEATTDWPLERCIDADSRLSKAGIITLSEVRRRFSRRFSAMLRRGRVTGDIEYYMAAAQLADTSSGLSATERVKLDEMVHSYQRGAA